MQDIYFSIKNVIFAIINTKCACKQYPSPLKIVNNK